jgi:hypothetical protein
VTVIYENKKFSPCKLYSSRKANEHSFMIKRSLALFLMKINLDS